MKQDMFQMMQHMHHKQTALETQNRQPIIIQNHANARKGRGINNDELIRDITVGLHCNQCIKYTPGKEDVRKY
jgi:hypothetical protein